MDKRLEDMTLEELWELFPIILTEHNPLWRRWAAEEITLVKQILCIYHAKFSHIGSTAIPGIKAKPIVDILIEVSGRYDWRTIKDRMCKAGYICMAESNARMSFNKGYTAAGYAEKVFHLHVHRVGDNDEILFRDYLLAHPDVAKEYERLKLDLCEKYRHDRDAYTAAKSGFVARVVRAAMDAKMQP